MVRVIKWLNNFEKDDIMNAGSKFYTIKEFKRALECERIRSERHLNHLSNLSLKFAQCEDSAGKEYPAFLKNIIYLLEKHTRDSDIKCLNYRTEINMLLVDTPLLNGYNVKHRLHQVFSEYFKKEKQFFLALTAQIEYHLSPIVIASNAHGHSIEYKHMSHYTEELIESNSKVINQ